MERLTLTDDEGDRLAVMPFDRVIVVRALDDEPVHLSYADANVLQAYLRRALIEAGVTLADAVTPP